MQHENYLASHRFFLRRRIANPGRLEFATGQIARQPGLCVHDFLSRRRPGSCRLSAFYAGKPKLGWSEISVGCQLARWWTYRSILYHRQHAGPAAYRYGIDIQFRGCRTDDHRNGPRSFRHPGCRTARLQWLAVSGDHIDRWRCDSSETVLNSFSHSLEKVVHWFIPTIGNVSAEERRGCQPKILLCRLQVRWRSDSAFPFVSFCFCPWHCHLRLSQSRPWLPYNIIRLPRNDCC
jgi:hypothetical protein